MKLRDLVEQQRKNPYLSGDNVPFIMNCEHPQRVYNKYIGSYVHVPCRKCRACLISLSQQKASLLVRDTSNYRFNFFVTLTYDNAHLPLAHHIGFHVDDNHKWFAEFQRSYYDALKRKRVYDDEIISVPIEDAKFREPKNILYKDCFSIADKVGFQKFIKRLRKRISKLPNYDKETYKIRYSFVTEFGPKTYRAHLHGILSTNCEQLAAALPFLISACWASYNKVQNGRYEQNGFCSPKRLTVQRIYGDGAQKYVCKYITGNFNLPKILLFKPFRSFFLNSRLPSLGLKKNDVEICKTVFNTCAVVQQVYNERTKEFVELLFPDVLFRKYFRKCSRFSTSSYRDRVSILKAYRAIEESGYSIKSLKKPDLSLLNDSVSDSILPIVKEKITYYDYVSTFFNETNKRYYQCFKMWLSIYPYLTPEIYVKRLDEIYSNRALYLLRSFYEKQEYVSQHVSDTAAIICMYPETLQSFPTLCSYQHWMYLDSKYNYSSFGLTFDDVYIIDQMLTHAFAYPWQVYNHLQENNIEYSLNRRFVKFLRLMVEHFDTVHRNIIYTYHNNDMKQKKYNDAHEMWEYV